MERDKGELQREGNAGIDKQRSQIFHPFHILFFLISSVHSSTQLQYNINPRGKGEVAAFGTSMNFSASYITFLLFNTDEYEFQAILQTPKTEYTHTSHSLA